MELLQQLAIDAQSKMVLMVFDGLGDVDIGQGTPLEAAASPNLDQFAAEGATGFHVPIATAVTPGSGPAHLALFGYDPLKFEIGRGILEALGTGFELQSGDVAIRINFCTVDQQGKITDRRAGRIPSSDGERCVEKLRQVRFPGVEIHLRHVKEYRAAMVLRGSGLGGMVEDTDPQKTGVPPLAPTLKPDADAESQKTVDLLTSFLVQARELLSDEPKANMLTLRGIDLYQPLPFMSDLYGIKACAIATYPMYKGVSRLAGMSVIEEGQETEAQEFDLLEKVWNDFDFFFLHIKKTDSYGEDGNWDGKKGVIEKVDQLMPRLRQLNPNVLVITGDHSTPCPMKSHSWHPVPLLIWGDHVRVDHVAQFGEKHCIAGGIGTIPGMNIMALMLAHAERLTKFGA